MSEIDLVKSWIENYIVRLDLCPYAMAVLDKDEITYCVIKTEAFSNSLEETFNKFGTAIKGSVKTSFIIFKEALNYLEFLDYYYEAEDYLLENENFEDIKLVAFHPAYEHGEVSNKNLHYSNRSPIPLIQLLSQKYLEENTNAKIVDSILMKNEDTLNERGAIELQNLLNDC